MSIVSDYSYPGKAFVDTSSIYTYTMSTVMHPSHSQVQPTRRWGKLSSFSVTFRTGVTSSIFLFSVPVTEINTTSTLPPTICSAIMSSKIVKPENTSRCYGGQSAACNFSTNSCLTNLLQERPDISPTNQNANSAGRLSSKGRSNAWPSVINNTLSLFGMSSKSGLRQQQQPSVSPSASEYLVGLGLLSTSMPPQCVYTRTMVSAKASSASSINNPSSTASSLTLDDIL